MTSIFGFQEPATEPNVFAELMHSEAVANLTDTTGWTVGAVADANLTFSGGKAIASGGQASTRYFQLATPSVLSGKKVGAVAYIEALAGGNLSLVGNGASSSKTGAITSPGRYMTNLVATGDNPVNFRESVVAGVAATVDSAHMFDLDLMLAKPWFIVLFSGQSNNVGAQTTPLDPALDIPAYGCVVFPGIANTGRGFQVDGSGNGLPALAVAPVTHSYPANTGGGPTVATLREIRKFVPEEFLVVGVCVGYSGAGFAGNGLWYKDATNSAAYDNFFKQARHVFDIAPVGSMIGGHNICQGESDVGSGQQAEWLVRVPDFLDEIDAEPGWTAPKGGGASWGHVPTVIGEIGGDTTTGDAAATNIINMIAAQKKLVTDSGDPLARPMTAYVERPADWFPLYNGDGLNVHFRQDTHRAQGPRIAQALRSLIYA